MSYSPYSFMNSKLKISFSLVFTAKIMYNNMVKSNGGKKYELVTFNF